ncbi:hypothetical protein SISNIDRAFT_457723 [Sistotremastrum niveocremeum HHB9708]|uniref:MutS protein homolog 3 n=1 Tax=Sistotremastrum niveocremeum HHB9708 TaxID=1314777 RepID=A0A164R3G5_9AGAM|nr:hypothetical protein SISNIDRAFT_457723 [Sistotremastrum niveocremeum HHB9708]
MSQETESLIKHIRDRGENSAGGRVREERFKGSPMDYSTAFEAVSSFYKAKESDISGPSSGSSEETRIGKLIATVVDLPQIVIVALAHVIQYLKQFELADVLAQTKFFMPFGNRHGMLLNSNTIDNLEIFQNQTDFKEYGSLWWILDRTKTKFGKRLLKHWVARPLTDKRLLQERIDVVEELNEDGIATLTKLKMMMKGLPDLAKGLSRIQYGTCTASELASVLSAFQRISTTFPSFTVPQDVGFKSAMLNELVFPLPQLRTPVQEIMAEIDMNKARLNELSGLWRDEDKYEAVGNANYNIMFLESDLQDHLKEVRKTLHRPSLQYKTIAGEEFLIEVPNEDSASVPASWTRVSKTKKDTRYHSPFIQDKLREREEYKETLAAEAKSAFRAFLRDISNKHYGLFRDVVQKLATVDCLLSLAHVALQSSYAKPVLGEDVIEIVGGRHPMIEAIRSDPYIPNSIKIGDGSPRSKIVTGPNMGGKSSCVRMIALICIMAQIGSYVPAESARLGILDSVLTRIGASDDIARGKSTFMVEISETADILRLATSNSLVILDELGRGTATFDGMAIASAVLQHLVQSINCKALFITHYSSVAEDMGKIFRRQIENVHMNFVEEEKLNGTREIHFLYTLTSGIASGSFGIECARLAGLPEKVLEAATVRAQTMQGLVRQRTVINKSRRLLSLSQGIMESRITTNMEATRIVAALHDLRQALLSV